MLALVEVYEWNTKHPGDRMAAYAHAYMLNTNRMINLVDEVYDGDACSRFLFSNNPNDPRDSPDRLVASLTVDQLRVYHDYVPSSLFGTIDIFPSKDVTNLGTAVATTIEWENIAYAYITYSDLIAGRTRMVYYDESWKRKEVFIDHSLIEFMALTLA
jgi:hypothetical protein